MADEVIVVFGAEVDGYNAQIKTAIGANDKLEQSANQTSAQISKDFANSGKAIQQAFAGKEVAKSLDTTKKAAEQLKGQIKALYDEELKLLKVSKNVATDGVAAALCHYYQLTKSSIKMIDHYKNYDLFQFLSIRSFSMTSALKKLDHHHHK